MIVRVGIACVAALSLAACGSTKQAAPATTSAAVAPATPATTTAPAAGPGALQAEVAATAAGDIPDNQIFVVYPGQAFRIKYAEGWTQTGSGNTVTFRDKNNIVRVVIATGKPSSAVPAGAKLASKAAPFSVGPARGIKLVYTTTSAPNPVTGKRVTLTVDRYELAQGRKLAIVDLGSPVGVDNVDAYRLMIESLRLR